jgi:hypothetical protein
MKLSIKSVQKIKRGRVWDIRVRVEVLNNTLTNDDFVRHGYYNRILIYNEKGELLTNTKIYGPDIEWANLSIRDVVALKTNQAIIIDIPVISIVPSDLKVGRYFLYAQIINPDLSAWSTLDLKKIQSKFRFIQEKRSIKSKSIIIFLN